MKIERIINGEKCTIELTDDELLKAYEEQRDNFDIKNIKEYLEECEERNPGEKYTTNEQIHAIADSFKDFWGSDMFWGDYWEVLTDIVSEAIDHN